MTRFKFTAISPITISGPLPIGTTVTVADSKRAVFRGCRVINEDGRAICELDGVVINGPGELRVARIAVEAGQ